MLLSLIFVPVDDLHLGFLEIDTYVSQKGVKNQFTEVKSYFE